MLYILFFFHTKSRFLMELIRLSEYHPYTES